MFNESCPSVSPLELCKPLCYVYLLSVLSRKICIEILQILLALCNPLIYVYLSSVLSMKICIESLQIHPIYSLENILYIKVDLALIMLITTLYRECFFVINCNANFHCFSMIFNFYIQLKYMQMT